MTIRDFAHPPRETETRIRSRNVLLDPETFRSPPAAYRGAPFWSWNGELNRERLFEQLGVYQKMGMGGAHMHVRTGMTTPYLGDEFLAIVRDCVDEAERLGMLGWLYDEDRWPSGFAGGLVTRDPRYRVRHLVMTRKRWEPGEVRMCPTHHGEPLPNSDREFVAAWAVRFDDEGRLEASRRVDESGEVGVGETALYAYREIVPSWSWFNNQQYLDTLNPEAGRRFIESTHERYAEALGDRMGRSAPAIFTDEPLFRTMERPADPHDASDLRLPWTDGLPAAYADRFGDDLLDALPAVFYDRCDGGHFLTRWRFYDNLTERFVETFARQLGQWCGEHGIALTGHMMEEPTLGRQSRWVGEVMRSLYHFQLPGIDMLCDREELLTIKQAQSIARQRDRAGVLSELYGVTNWDFPFAGHLAQGNWQTALGVSVRVHHLTWYSMAGEAKRDYPASIGQHSPWWGEYRGVEDHFARLNVALTSGEPRCRVAMIHPIESFWIADGPRRTWADTQADLEDGIARPLRWLLEGLIDVDLIAESLLPDQHSPTDDASFAVGSMRYEAVVVPPMLTMRRSTLERLAAFADAGGMLIWLGAPPAMVDAEASEEARELAARTSRCSLQRASLLALLEPRRDVEVHDTHGKRAEGVLYQLREEADGSRILFLCRTDRQYDLEEATLRVRGRWQLERCDTSDGSFSPFGERWEGQTTCAEIDLPVAGHLLLRLRPGEAPRAQSPRRTWSEAARLAETVPITLDEPNVLLLDRGEWRVDGNDWQRADEILRIDNHARRACGMPERHGNIAQPWCDPPAPPSHRVAVAFAIRSEVRVAASRLALERADVAEIRLDENAVAQQPDGWWVDRDIETVTLPDLEPGEHRLEISWPLGDATGLEACYLLGDFGVHVAGTRARLTAPVRELTFGDWTQQGLAFYGGNVTYHCEAARPDGPWALRVPHFRNPLIAVEHEGQRVGRIIHSPYRLQMPDDAARRSRLDLIAFGNRFNTFGCVHNVDPNASWFGPPAWRTEGSNWTDGYKLRPCGILVAPMIEQSS